MRHFMAQFGPALQWPWTKLMDVPELTRRAARHGSSRSRTSKPAARSCASSSAARRLPRRDHPGPARRRLGAGETLAATLGARAARDARGADDAPLRLTRRSPRRLGRLQRPRPREPLPAGRSATRRDALLRGIGVDLAAAAATSRSRPTSRTSASRTPATASQYDAGPRPRRQAPARLPRALLRDERRGPSQRRSRCSSTSTQRQVGRSKSRESSASGSSTCATSTHRSRGRSARAASACAINEPRSPPALRAALARDRRSVRRSGEVGLLVRARRGARLAPSCRSPRRTQRRRGARPARSPLAGRAARRRPNSSC